MRSSTIPSRQRSYSDVGRLKYSAPVAVPRNNPPRAPKIFTLPNPTFLAILTGKSMDPIPRKGFRTWYRSPECVSSHSCARSFSSRRVSGHYQPARETISNS